ncbi:hypothetical protein V2J09_013373 [Rumex salicifolius]
MRSVIGATWRGVLQQSLAVLQWNGLEVKSKGTLSWRKFSLKELHSATNNFNYDNKLGEGAFGSFYWGQIWDGSQVINSQLHSSSFFLCGL